MKKVSYLIWSVFFTLFMACSSPYTYKDNGSTIELSEDDPFEIGLKSEASSDFKWQLDSSLEFIKLLGTSTVKDNDDTIVYNFNFKTLSDGEEVIRLVLTNGITVNKVFEIKVIVGTIGRITSE